MDKLKELLKKQEELKTEIHKYKEKLCIEKLKSLGLEIGDKVELTKQNRSRQGFISSIKINWNDNFELVLKAVKKDGTPSKNNIYMYSDIEKYTKVM